VERGARAFSSEVGTGSREENAPKQKIRASVLIRSEPVRPNGGLPGAFRAPYIEIDCCLMAIRSET
jgi:hypothetical protein